MENIVEVSLPLTAEDIAELVCLMEDGGSDHIAPVKDYLKMFITYENKEETVKLNECP
jgi:hypothetical protein